MDINYIALSIFIINIISVLGSGDCDVFNDFLNKQGYSVECCGNSPYVLCEGQNIKSITLDSAVMSNYFKPISFVNFPLFQNLKHLTITSNGDTDADIFNGNLPDCFFELPSLEILEVTKSNIQNIPKNISLNNKLVKINLSSNNITTFPYQFKSLPTLIELDVSHNRINGGLTMEIKEFATLKNLDINTNDFDGELIIPDSLEFICVNTNKFNSFSASNSLEKLENLQAISNMFDDNIFHSVIKSKRLKTLTLGRNPNIRSIPNDIYLLNSLENIDISATNITLLPNNFFSLSNLNYLNIAYNPQLHPTMVNFGNKINVCKFTDTPLTCYQSNTCGFIFGYTKYRNCYDYEIEQVHTVSSKISISNFDESKESHSLFKYIIIGGTCLVVLLLLAILTLNYQMKIRRLKKADIIISTSNGLSSFEEKSENSLSREHLLRKSNTSQSLQSNKFSGKRVTINVPPSPQKTYQTSPYSAGPINHSHSHNVVPLNAPIIINNVQSYTNNYQVYPNNLQAYHANNIPMIGSHTSTIPSLLRGSSSSSHGSYSNVSTINGGRRNSQNITNSSSLRVSEASIVGSRRNSQNNINGSIHNSESFTNGSSSRHSSKSITFADEQEIIVTTDNNNSNAITTTTSAITNNVIAGVTTVTTPFSTTNHSANTTKT